MSIQDFEKLIVYIQIWGPTENSGCNYGWINLAKIEHPPGSNLTELKNIALDFIKRSEYKPVANMARLKFMHRGKTAMKVTFLDLW
ncbi:MAG: hypothetical protein HY518_04665 [Candidatus Aenigmarchaeota archaeon]|nr:hypothetical protein [Candidatus Aenigmarchaeota archaeon]